MATDSNQIMQDSRKAAMSFLDAAKNKAAGRKNRRSSIPGGRGAGVRGSSRAVDDFLSAGKRNEERYVAKERGEVSPFDIAQKVRTMSDEEFEKAMADGSITPEQLRKAGEYDWDVYMGDVWIENPDNEDAYEPDYDEFVADPEKYGYHRGWNEDDDRAFDRYKRTVKQQ